MRKMLGLLGEVGLVVLVSLGCFALILLGSLVYHIPEIVSIVRSDNTAISRLLVTLTPLVITILLGWWGYMKLSKKSKIEEQNRATELKTIIREAIRKAVKEKVKENQ